LFVIFGLKGRENRKFMKTVVNIVRVIVGALFIFSGLIKANDPLGLSYKMEEFFDLWNQGLSKGGFFLNHLLIQLFEFLRHQSLALSVLMIAFEIIAGVALLLGWRIKIFSWLLLLLILFFTFLTGYAYLSTNPDGSPKFSNCGCFGDCIPLTVATSFLKDVALTIMIFFIFFNKDKIRPVFNSRTNVWIMLATTIFSFGLQWWVLTYLPLIDCLPFKKGNNITEQMKLPANAVPDVKVITYVYEKDGKKIEFTADKFPADFKTPPYKYIDRYDKIVKKGKNNEPPIKGFGLKAESGEDSTQAILALPRCFLLFCENFKKPVSDWQKDFIRLKEFADVKNIPVYIVSSSLTEAKKAIQSTPFANIPLFECDYTAIRTAARTNPCLYLLKQGTVVNKWSYKQMTKGVREIEKK
jgi:uncharacterized membrane protein YphA (DoxX/SURF4 family)